MHGVGNLPAPVTDIHAPQAGHAIHDPVAVGIPQKHALATHDHPALFPDQRLMVAEGVQVMGGIGILQFGSREMIG